MGYTLTIGNAVPRMPSKAEVEGDETRTPDWTVEGGRSDAAPSFPGEWGPNSSRSPSYTGWAFFCRDTELSSLFYGACNHARKEGIAERETSLLENHPGVALLRASDLAEVRHAIAMWQAKPWPTSVRIPGWEPNKDGFDGEKTDPRYDGNLARLLWLEFWIDWALKNCEHPAMGNT